MQEDQDAPAHVRPMVPAPAEVVENELLMNVDSNSNDWDKGAPHG